MIVKAAVARVARGPLVIETMMLEDPRADEVLVRLVASGVAWSDLEAMATGAFPFVPGAEGAGIVERVGEAVRDVAPRDAVIVFAAAQGARGDGSSPLSSDAGPVGGFFRGQSSFATHALCKHSSVARVDPGAPLELLAALGGDVVGAVTALADGLAFAAGATLVVTGAGAAGLATVMMARVLGAATIVVADPSRERRDLATDLGADVAVHTDDDLAAVVRSLTGAGADFGLDATGHPAAVEACRRSLDPRGVCGLLRPPTLPPVSDPAAGARLLDLSSGAGPERTRETLATLAAHHAEGRFPIEKLVHYFPFEHINDAAAALESGTAVKPVVRFSIGGFGDLDRAEAEGAAVGEPDDAGERPDEAVAVPAVVVAD